MILAVAATEIEMAPFLAMIGDGKRFIHCTTGVGPVETAVRLTSFLGYESRHKSIRAVLNFGVAGAYPAGANGPEVDLLDICLAEYEILGDFGICFENHIELFDEDLNTKNSYKLDSDLLQKGKQILTEKKVKFHCGNFITVSCASGLQKRGEIFKKSFKGLCENMEGAAIARVCEEFSLPLLEIRCISNMVEDRDLSSWKLSQACKVAAENAALLIKKIEL